MLEKEYYLKKIFTLTCDGLTQFVELTGHYNLVTWGHLKEDYHIDSFTVIPKNLLISFYIHNHENQDDGPWQAQIQLAFGRSAKLWGYEFTITEQYYNYVGDYKFSPWFPQRIEITDIKEQDE